MAVIAVVGGPGAPGATTTALALLLAWPLQPGRRILLVEADPDGGAVLAGALEGRVEAVYGLRNLAVADRRGLLAQTIWEQLIDLSPDGEAERLLLPGLTDPTQAPGLAYTWEPLAELLHGIEQQGYDVIVDLGRSGATGASAVLARRADVVVATVRTTLRGLSAIRPRLSALAEDLASGGTGADALGLLLVAEGPYPRAEVARELGLPVLGVLPYAVRTAKVLSDGGDTTDRRFIRSELMRTARSAADEVQLLVRRRRQRLAPNAEPAATPAQLAAPAPVAAPGPVPMPVQPTPMSAPAAYGQPSYAQPSYAQPSYAQTSYTQAPQDQAAQVQPPYGQAPYGKGGYAQAPYGPVDAEPPSYTPPQPVPPVIVTGPVAPLAGLAPQPAAPAPFPAHVQSPQQAHRGDQGDREDRVDPDDQYPLQQPTVTDGQVQLNGQYPHNPGEVLRAR
ncbi:cellulose biosynthesis protein BcsQ [Streptomyces sp. 1114.5]|uniref:hypothetical protein n=1 Tax=Streptomyces sp. 1114.5 TaxID=1938830 RepID=UPI000F1AAF6E|nr:hypothetical protein [Streptomyces sp. 1114.5]RKT11778.1 cellulose biosynthesis protein BcsQ [Streptomyces sp. 1114.5]